MHKNWKEICKIGEKDWCLMIAIANADPKSHLGQCLQKAFPKCFSARRFRGPVPLSVLKDYAETKAPSRSGYGGPEEALASVILDDHSSPFNIPYIRFAITEDIQKQYGYPMWPHDDVNAHR